MVGVVLGIILVVWSNWGLKRSDENSFLAITYAIGLVLIVVSLISSIL